MTSHAAIGSWFVGHEAPGTSPAPKRLERLRHPCRRPRITTWINGVLATDYREPDPDIIDSGRIGFQVHAGGVVQAYFKDITPRGTPCQTEAEGRRRSRPPPHASPLTPEEQVAHVQPSTWICCGTGRPRNPTVENLSDSISITRAASGRDRARYPLDANEAGAEAKALFDREVATAYWSSTRPPVPVGRRRVPSPKVW